MKDCSTLLRELVAMDPYKIFTEPVDAVAFSLPDYNQFIKTPMDFRTLRQRMTYTEMSPTEFAQLVNLIFDNALHYNGASKNCLVCVEARRLKNHFNDKYESLSRNREVEKKSPKIFTTLQTPTKVVDQSKGPVTLSKIMRDCSSLLQELIKSDAHKIFTEAVDAVAFDLPDYHQVIHSPMDFRTLRQRVTYTEMTHSEFSKLVNLTFDNALLYNGGNLNCLVCVEANRLKKFFNERYAVLRSRA